MNQDYLWSKAGTDPEVESLENLLSEFRFDGSIGPEMPATNIIPVTTVSKRRWVFGLSFAATAAAALFLMAMWFTKAPNTPIARDQNDPNSVQDTAGSRNDATSSIRSDDSASTAFTTPQPIRLAQPITRQPPPRVDRAGHVAKVRKTEKLTKEERYAYDRLMYALAITGSKLKMVQDSVDRKRDTNPHTTRNEK
jgi:hypothetical protein